jgi:signal recognition particle subunit SEC65
VPEHFYIYPTYLRRKGSRADGRRVPAAIAPAEASPEAIVEAARRLGFTAEAEPAKLYPRQSHLFEGRVKVAKKAGTKKAAALRQIAERLRTDAEARARAE